MDFQLFPFHFIIVEQALGFKRIPAGVFPRFNLGELGREGHQFNLSKCWDQCGGGSGLCVGGLGLLLAAGSSVETDPLWQMDRYLTPAPNEPIS